METNPRGQENSCEKLSQSGTFPASTMMVHLETKQKHQMIHDLQVFESA